MFQSLANPDSNALDFIEKHLAGTMKRNEGNNDEKENKKEKAEYIPLERRPIVGTVSELHPNKGLTYLIEAAVEIKKKFPKIKCLVLTMQKDQEHFKIAMANGALGYILKDNAFDLLVMAIKMAMKGKSYISPAIAELIAEQYVRSIKEGDMPSLEILTSREKEILKLVAHGDANKNIAARLKISIRTVEAHRNHLIHKLGFKTTAALVKYALDKGLI